LRERSSLIWRAVDFAPATRRKGSCGGLPHLDGALGSKMQRHADMNVSPIVLTSERYLDIVEEVHARLSPICHAMSAPLFDQMVERIALVQLTFELRDT
jgi:hypothetical protein